MRYVSESKLMKTLLKKGVDFDTAHLLSMEAVMLLLENEKLDIDKTLEFLIQRELSKAD